MSKLIKVLLAVIAFVALKLSIASASPLSQQFEQREAIITVNDPQAKSDADAAINEIRRLYEGNKALVLVKIQGGLKMIQAQLHGFNLYSLIIGESSCPKEKYTEECKLDQGRPLRRCFTATGTGFQPMPMIIICAHRDHKQMICLNEPTCIQAKNSLNGITITEDYYKRFDVNEATVSETDHPPLSIDSESPLTQQVEQKERNITNDDPQVKSDASVAINEIRRVYEGDRALVLVKVQSGTKSTQGLLQVLYHYLLIIGESSCPNDKYTEECKLDQSRPLRRCTVTTSTGFLPAPMIIMCAHRDHKKMICINHPKCIGIKNSLPGITPTEEFYDRFEVNEATVSERDLSIQLYAH